MTLARHLAQGQLLYFSQQADAMSVSENAHLRWLAFDGVLQSVVRKQRPHWLTLPHHWALLMPWLYYKPSKVVEFGLGGGNHLLFHHWLTSEIEHQVIEASEAVIAAGKQFFGLSPYSEHIHHQTAQQWLTNNPTLDTDWLIFDIYQKPKVGDNSRQQLLQQVIEQLPTGTLLSINFPEATQQDVQYWHPIFTQKISHQIHYYTVPHYQNFIVHLLPRQPRTSLGMSCVLPPRWQKRWQQYQQQFGLKTS